MSLLQSLFKCFSSDFERRTGYLCRLARDLSSCRQIARIARITPSGLRPTCAAPMFKIDSSLPPRKSKRSPTVRPAPEGWGRSHWYQLMNLCRLDQASNTCWLVLRENEDRAALLVGSKPTRVSLLSGRIGRQLSVRVRGDWGLSHHCRQTNPSLFVRDRYRCRKSNP